MLATYENLTRFVEWARFLGVSDRDAFELAADHFDHFGVEFCVLGDAASMQYLNQGDTYDITLILDSEDGLFVTSWGDWYDYEEQQYCEEYGVIRCGYCGEFTDCAKEWRDTVCEHCGYSFN